MVDDDTPTPITLGTFVRQARERARLSLRHVAAITGVPRSKLHRLEHDHNIEAEAVVLQRLAEALELDSDDLFALAGYRPSAKLPSLMPYLRAKYHLPPKALAAATVALRDILDAYDRSNDAW